MKNTKNENKINLTKGMKTFLIILSVITAVCLVVSIYNYAKDTRELEEITNTFTVLPDEDGENMTEETTISEREIENMDEEEIKNEVSSLEITADDLKLLSGSSQQDKDYENKDWAKDKFSGKHNENPDVKEEILKNISNPSSYKHVETNYQYITNTDVINTANETLSRFGYNLNIEYGDVCVLTKFTSKDDDKKRTEKTAVSLIDEESGELVVCKVL